MAALPAQEPAAIAETHTSVVVFVGDRAFKLKKPVNLGFLDFRQREQRAAACRDEVELNRRLAPDVYLGVADVRGPDGELCEHLVVMRRMAAKTRLSAFEGPSRGSPLTSSRGHARSHRRGWDSPELARMAANLLKPTWLKGQAMSANTSNFPPPVAARSSMGSVCSGGDALGQGRSTLLADWDLRP